MRPLLLLCVASMSLGVQTNAPEPLRVEGEYVLTVTALPVTIHAPDVEGLKFISWHYPQDATVEIRNDNRELLIRSLPPGDSLIWGDFGCVVDGQAQAQFMRRVMVRNGTTDIPPPKPDEPDLTGPKSTAIVYPEETPIPLEGQAAADTLREQGDTVFFVNAGAETIDGTTPAFLQTAIAEAEKVGLPAVVVMYGDKAKASQKLTTKAAAVAFVGAN